MVFNKVEQILIKIVDDLWTNVTWSTTLCIYLPPMHPPIYLINYLVTY
jgi:hypothetical protein